MLFNTPTEWVTLGITLFAGWLFGLASSSGGAKWKRQLQEEEESSAAWREEAERAQRRIRELEGERDAALARPGAPATSPAMNEVRSGDTGGGTSFLPLAAAAGAGAVAATVLNRDTKNELTPTPDAAKNWIPEGPPPPPLAMGTPEPAPQPQPQPIAPDAPAHPIAPAPPQEEVKAAQSDPSFSPPAPVATAAATPAAETAPPTSTAAEPTATAPVNEGEQVQKGHEWLPPHVRA